MLAVALLEVPVLTPLAVVCDAGADCAAPPVKEARATVVPSAASRGIDDDDDNEGAGCCCSDAGADGDWAAAGRSGDAEKKIDDGASVGPAAWAAAAAAPGP